MSEAGSTPSSPGHVKIPNPLQDDVPDTPPSAKSAASQDLRGSVASASGGSSAPAAQADSGPSALLLFIQAFVTIIFGPLSFFFNITVLIDIFATSRWDFFSPEMFILVLLPAMSFSGASYIFISYWMDMDSWSVLRMRTMFASIPMCIFFGLNLCAQSAHHNWFRCDVEAYIQQIAYLQINCWQTMTVLTAYRFVCMGLGKFTGFSRVMVHVCCWGGPIILTTILAVIWPDSWHEDLFESEMRGIGWCGVKSEMRLRKALFVNTPQLVMVSFYAQFYWYIHQEVDPVEDGSVEDLSDATKMSTSKNAALMGAAAVRKQKYMEKTALQLRMFMLAYMLSFLTNTLLVIISDNMTAGVPGRASLLLQAAVVAPQGVLTGIVYARTAAKSLIAAYVDAIQGFLGKFNPEIANKMKQARAAAIQARIKAAQSMQEKATDHSLGEDAWNIVQGFFLMPVAIYIWTPMEFLGENFGNRMYVLIGLVIWGMVTVYPFYMFSLNVARDRTDWWNAFYAHAYVVGVVCIAALAVWNNRYTHKLLIIEDPIRRKGLFSSIGQGLRLSSMRNSMSIFTLTLEFYQIWGLTWSATRMSDLYEPKVNGTDTGTDTVATTGTAVVDSSGSWEEEEATLKLEFNANFFKFWGIILMCMGWAILYGLPSLITTTTVGYRTLAYNWTEKYRKYLWFMSGAGFLTIMKSLMKVLFCVDCDVIDIESACSQSRGIDAVVLMDYSIGCWSTLHLQMTAIALLSFIVFFPSASLTCLFRYGSEDDRGCGGMRGPRGDWGEPSDGWYQEGAQGEGGNGGFTRIRKGGGPDKYIGMGETGEEEFECEIDPATQRPWAGGCQLGGEDIRWIHLWRRIEYIIKGLWIFTGLRFIKFGQWACGALFFGSLIIAVANFFMQPSNLKFIGRWKFLIHACNTWTTITCFWANASENDSKVAHFAILIPGWVLIQAIVIGYEVYLFKNDVFKREVGDAENLAQCQREVLSLRNTIAHTVFLNRWGSHHRIVRLMRLCEHPDVEIQRTAFAAIAMLQHQDQLSESFSFFAMLCPTNPGVQILLNAIEGHPDAEIRNDATRAFTGFLQMNAGNRYGVLVTFHSILQEIDDKKGNVVAEGLVDYANSIEDRTLIWHQVDAVQMLVEMGNSDSNDLPAVADKALPMLTEWLDKGNVVQQYIATQLIFKTANRFDLANQVLKSDAVRAMLTLFTRIADQYDDWGDASSEADGFRGKDDLMPPSYTCPCQSLPSKFKKQFMVAEVAAATADDEWGVPQDVTLTKEQLCEIQGDIMVMAVQTVVDLAFAASASGRKELLDCGGLDVIVRCLGFRKEKGLKSAGENSVHNKLQFEAFRASNSFLSGTFGEEEIEIDDDYKAFHAALSAYAEDPDAEEMYTLKGLTPVQRRKAHIIAEYLNLNHESVGMQATRSVEFSRRTVGFSNPMMGSDGEKVEEVDTSSGSPRGGAFGEESDKDTEIYKENWKRVSDTGIARILLDGLAKNFEKLTSLDVQFQVIDVLLQLVEHDLISDEELPAVRELMLTALSMGERGLAVMGAKGMEVIIVRDGLYTPYGSRIAALGKGKKLLLWCFKMTYWVIFWKYHSGSMGKMFESDELL